MKDQERTEEEPQESVTRAQLRAERLRAAYEAKVNDLAAETLRTAMLIGALHAEGHRASEQRNNRHCRLCIALREVGALDPAVSP